VDTVRSLLDGHIVLDRNLSARGHFPAISVLDSLSRLMPNVCTQPHVDKVRSLRLLLSAYQRSEDLIRIGAYQAGTDPVLDKAVAAVPPITTFLQQGRHETAELAQTQSRLMALPT